jgi:hypothetical protein
VTLGGYQLVRGGDREISRARFSRYDTGTSAWIALDEFDCRTLSGNIDRNFAATITASRFKIEVTGSTTLGPRITEINAIIASPSPLSVVNLAPGGITENQAVLNANLSAPTSTCEVIAYWGPSDGGTNAGSWAASAALGSWSNAVTNISYTAIGLTPDQDYYCTFMASNAAGTVWASPSWRMRTLPSAGPVTVNHAVPHSWLLAQNPAWTNYETVVNDDEDGDGFSTAQEYWCGTDPRNSNSVLRIDGIEFGPGSTVRLLWQHARVGTGIPALGVQARSSFGTGDWVNVGQKVPANGTNTWEGSSSVQQFYRVCVTNMP